MRSATFVLFALALLGARPAAGQSWDPRFGGPGGSGTSFDVDADGHLYAFGSDYLGSFLVRGVGRWDGQRWHREQPNDSLRALTGVVWGDDDLFVYAQTRGGQQSFRQRVDGVWSIAGPAAAPGYVNVMKEAPDGRVCYGGEIRNLFPSWTAGFACWDGTDWWHPTSIGGGFGTLIYDFVFDARGRIYVGGSFSANPPGGRPIENIVRLDGDQVEQLGAGLPMVQAAVNRVAFDSDSALVVAGFGRRQGGANQETFIFRFDGDTWTEIPSPEGLRFSTTVGQFPFLALKGEADGRLLILGRTLAGNAWLRWDGSAWTNVDAEFPAGPETAPNGNPSAYFDLGGGRSVVVGGYVAPGSGAPVSMLEGRNGTWRPFGLSIGDAVLALAALPDGSLLAAGDNFHHGVARWTGQGWEPFGTDLCPPNSQRCRPLTLAVAPNGNVAVGGNFGSNGNGVIFGVAEWDGTQWTSLGGGTFQRYAQVLAYDAQSRLYGQFGLTLGTGISPGYFQPTRLGERGWEHISAPARSVGPLTNGPDGSLYAGNPSDALGALAGYRVVRYNGTDWEGVGPQQEGTSGLVTHVAADGRVFVATGAVCDAGGECRVEVFTLDGNAWRPLGVFVEDGPTDSDYPFFVYALATGAGGRLYAAGRFTRVFAGGDTGLAGSYVEAANVAVWDGAAWSAVDGGLVVTDERNDDRRALVRDLQVVGDAVWAGGFFDASAGGTPSLGIARFGASPVAAEPLPRASEAAWTLSLYPNPSHGEATLVLDLAAPTRRLRVTVHDVLGRTLRTVVDAPAAAGRSRYAVPTDGLAAGVYLVRIHDGTRTTARRLVVL